MYVWTFKNRLGCAVGGVDCYDDTLMGEFAEIDQGVAIWLGVEDFKAAVGR